MKKRRFLSSFENQIMWKIRLRDPQSYNSGLELRGVPLRIEGQVFPPLQPIIYPSPSHTACGGWTALLWLRIQRCLPRHVLCKRETLGKSQEGVIGNGRVTGRLDRP